MRLRKVDPSAILPVLSHFYYVLPGIGGTEFMRHLETADLIPNGDIAGLISGLPHPAGCVTADRGGLYEILYDGTGTALFIESSGLD